MGNKKKIIIMGCGGHSKVLMEIIRMTDEYEIAGILDPVIEAGTVINGVTVIGDDSMLSELKARGIMNACIAVGSVKDNSRRKIVYESVRSSGLDLPCLVHPRAIVSAADTELSEGVQVMAGAIIQTGSRINENTIINTGAVIEHDCVIGKNVHICPGAVVCGGSVIKDNAFVGAGAIIIQGLIIGEGAVVGAGAVVKRDLSDGELVREIARK